MKIIKRISDNVVIYRGDSLTLDATGAGNGDWIDKSTTTAVAALVEGGTLPADWSGGHYTLVGAVWARSAAGTAAGADALTLFKAAACAQINDAVAAVLGPKTRFGDEYKDREKEAKEFKAAGYLGIVPPRVAEFATPALMTPTAATDLILSQAAQMRAALADLGGQRMRQYEVKNAATDAAARTALASILANIAAIGKAIA